MVENGVSYVWLLEESSSGSSSDEGQDSARLCRWLTITGMWRLSPRTVPI